MCESPLCEGKTGMSVKHWEGGEAGGGPMLMLFWSQASFEPVALTRRISPDTLLQVIESGCRNLHIRLDCCHPGTGST